MKDIGFTEVVVVILLICAGIVIGQGFEFDKVKIGDFLAALALVTTSLFAYLGLRHNKILYLNSIRPVIEKLSTVNDDNLTYQLEIHNCGTGPALKMKYNIIFNSKHQSHEVFPPFLKDFCVRNGIKLTYGALLGMSPNTTSTLLQFECCNAQAFINLKKVLSDVEVQVSYQSVQNEDFEKHIKLSDGL